MTVSCLSGKLVKAQREFIWHYHDKTDEMFMVMERKMKIAFRVSTPELGEEELVVVLLGCGLQTSL